MEATELSTAEALAKSLHEELDFSAEHPTEIDRVNGRNLLVYSTRHGRGFIITVEEDGAEIEASVIDVGRAWTQMDNASMVQGTSPVATVSINGGNISRLASLVREVIEQEIPGWRE